MTRFFSLLMVLSCPLLLSANESTSEKKPISFRDQLRHPKDSVSVRTNAPSSNTRWDVSRSKKAHTPASEAPRKSSTKEDLNLASETNPERLRIATEDVSDQSKPPVVRILIGKKLGAALVDIKGKFYLYDPGEKLLLSNGSSSKREFLFPSEKGLVWGNEPFPQLYRLRIVPADGETTVLVNGIQYKGCVEIYQTSGVLDIVNEVDVENFLKSTLALQSHETYKNEVMDSLAIVARTNVCALAAKAPHAIWHLDAKEIGYTGYGLTLQNLPVEEAIENTRYIILTYDNSPFATSWTEDSAGRTAPFSAIFRKDEPSSHEAPGVKMPLAEAERVNHRWSFAISKKELANLARLTKVSEVDLYLDKSSNKAYAMKISDGTRSKDLSFFTLQKALGPEKLKSNDFSVQLKEEKVIFTGFGAGHGVGLCLFSASKMAEKGMTADKILASTYPGAKLQSFNKLKK